MILQLILTMTFGFGVMTLATIALLNTAGHRLHDLHNIGEGPEPTFIYTYISDHATRLRRWFATMPLALGIAAIVAIVAVGTMYGVSDTPVPPEPQSNGEEKADRTHLEAQSIAMWVTVSFYVVALSGVTATFSFLSYKAIQQFPVPSPD